MKPNYMCISFAAVSITLVFLAQLGNSLPTSALDNQYDHVNDNLSQTREQLNQKACVGNRCDKGRLCEAICKNNPAEGGKMCK